jgi:hypothetical protein
LALIAIEHIDQSNESDLHLLTRLARQHGAVSKPVAGFRGFVSKGEAKSATGQQLPFPLCHCRTNRLLRIGIFRAQLELYGGEKFGALVSSSSSVTHFQ